jgi:hypothetical protein
MKKFVGALAQVRQRYDLLVQSEELRTSASTLGGLTGVDVSGFAPLRINGSAHEQRN